MTDVSHELGALRHVVDSSLSSKVAMFNKQANQHKENQLLNPFSGESGRRSPKPSFSKDEYGKPLAGSLTESRGQKANIHVLREMLELCQIIDSEGYTVKDEPTMRVIPFGELFNIYNYISDKVVGICLRARKHKLIEFEGEMLFQRRDDDVPIFLLKPIKEIRQILDDKTEEIKRGASPAPQATSVLLDKRSRSASPNVRKIETKKEETAAKVPEEKESVKVVQSTKTEKVDEVAQVEPTPKINNLSIEKESAQTNLDISVNSNNKNLEETPLQLQPSLSQEETQSAVKSDNALIIEVKNLQPTIVVNDEDNNNAIVSEKSFTENQTSNSEEIKLEKSKLEETVSTIEVPEVKQEKTELLSASSSVLEIIEEIVTKEERIEENSKADENNNNNTINSVESNETSDPI